MPFLREKHAVALVFTVLNSNLKTFAAAGLIIMSFFLFAATIFFGISHNASYSREIQKSREQVYRQTCEETNSRHDATIVRLVSSLSTLSPSQRRAAVSRQVRDKGLIDVLVPKRDCKKYANQVSLSPPGN